MHEHWAVKSIPYQSNVNFHVHLSNGQEAGMLVNSV